MENEDRIRKWREQRGAETSSKPSLLGDRAERLLGERAERKPSFTPAEPDDRLGGDRMAGDPALEDTRYAIIERRRMRMRATLRRALLFVGVPLLAVLLYMRAFATPLYQGEAAFTVQTSSSSAPSPTAGLFVMNSGSSTIADAFKARDFILSRPMMEQMEQRFGFLTHFASYHMDPLTRFQSPLGLNKDPYRYYLKRVRVAVDVQEGILRLYVQARTREDAIRFGNGILAAAERHVNDLSQKISEDQISALTLDVQNAERQVADTRRSLAMVQARRGELSPEQTAASVYQLISQLEVQRAEAERERDSLLDQGLTESPLLPRLNARVEELRSQIAQQRGRLVNPGGTSLATALNEYEGASAKKEIAQARWQSTLNTLQQAYLNILEQRRYFVIVVGMSASNFPKVRDVLTIAGPVLALVALLYLLLFALSRTRGTRGGFAGSYARIVDRFRRR